MNIVSISRSESRNQVEFDQLVRGFTRRPQTQDDLFTSGENESNELVNVTEDTDNTFLLDVVANDRGRKPESIWSLDDGVDSDPNGFEDLLDQDVVGEKNSSAMGAQISVTADGKVAYTYTEALHAELQSLAEGEFIMDTFVYALRLENETLSLATATVKISGINDAPELTGTMVDLLAGVEGESYSISTNDLLVGFTDIDDDLLAVSNLTATHGTLSESVGGWVFIPDQHFNGVVDLNYVVIDQHGGSVDAVQHFNLEPASDTTAPLLIDSFPWDGATHKVENNIQLNFDEMVVAGSGDIVLSNGSDTRTFNINDTSQVSFGSSKQGGFVFINPTDDLIPNTDYHLQIASGAITDVAGNAYEGISAEAPLKFVTIPSNPLLESSTPWDDSIFKIDNDIQLIFEEVVMAGSGDIIISNGSDTRTISINDASQVVFNGSKVAINPTDDLVLNTTYNIQLASGVIKDVDGNSYAGIMDETTLNFTTVLAEPLLIGSNPGDNSTFKIDNNIYMYFDERVTAGSGDIIISNGSDTRTIDINDTSQVTFDRYGGVIINPVDDLILNAAYNIQLASGVIKDIDGNSYAGIIDETTLNFTTVPAEPLLIGSTPGDNSILKIDNDIQLRFDDGVIAGGGEIVISNDTDTRTISVNDASQVSFNGSKVTINPTDDLIPNTSYNVQIAEGVITDSDGNAYAGISDETTLNFTTIQAVPLLIGGDFGGNFKIDSDIHLYFDERVVAGSGDIIISNGSDTRSIDINDVSQVTFDGYSGVIINPVDDLILDTTYNIQLASGAIKDIDGNSYAGIMDEMTLNFTTVPAEPLLAGSNLGDDSTLKIDNDIHLYFDEMVVAGSGDITISNGSDTRTIDINDTNQVIFDGYSGVIINLVDSLMLDTTYNIQLASGVIKDINGNSYAGIMDEMTLNFTTVPAEPLLVASNPEDDSTFKVDNDIHLYFDEMVAAGSGDIIISNGLDTRTIDINDVSQVTFDGYSGVIINPVDDLILDATYNIQLTSGVINDINGNSFAGIMDETTLNFTTVSAEPLLTGSNPEDGATLKVEDDIQLNFDETVIPGSGDIIISNGTDTRLININDTSQVVFNSSKSKVTINPTDDLIPNTSYNVQIAEGVITDSEGNAYAGISDETTFNFTTIGSDPLLIGSNPWDEAVNIHVSNDLHLYFDEAVTAGSGNIIISNGSDTRTIDINDASQVTFDGHSGIFINPLDDLIPDTSYHIQLVSGVITDFAGNLYAGINDSTTLNFTTTADPSFITMAGVIDPGVGILM